jgi:hypothetical protein
VLLAGQLLDRIVEPLGISYLEGFLFAGFRHVLSITNNSFTRGRTYRKIKTVKGGVECNDRSELDGTTELWY